jgi:hypothetical protein
LIKFQLEQRFDWNLSHPSQSSTYYGIISGVNLSIEVSTLIVLMEQNLMTIFLLLSVEVKDRLKKMDNHHLFIRQPYKKFWWWYNIWPNVDWQKDFLTN